MATPVKFCASCGAAIPQTTTTAQTGTSTVTTTVAPANNKCDFCGIARVPGKTRCPGCGSGYETVVRECTFSGCTELIKPANVDQCKLGHKNILAIGDHPNIICRGCNSSWQIDDLMVLMNIPHLFETPVGTKVRFHGGSEDKYRKFWEIFCEGVFDPDDHKPAPFRAGGVLAFLNSYFSCKCGAKGKFDAEGFLDSTLTWVNDPERRKKVEETGSKIVGGAKTLFNTINEIRKKADALGKK